MRFKFFVILVAICFNFFSAIAQPTRGSLAVQRFPETFPAHELLVLKTAKQDTNRVNTLLKVSSIYWHQRSTNPIYLDSVLFYIREALALSAKLDDVHGHNEACFILCKALIEKADISGAKKILGQVSGEERVRLLLVFGEHYSFAKSDQEKNIALSIPFIKTAIAESEAVHSSYWKAQSLDLMGKTYFEKGDIEKGKQSFLEIINYYKKEKDLSSEANYWHELAIYLPVADANYPYVIQCFKECIRLYLLINDKKNAGYAMTDMADHVYGKNLDSAENIYLNTVKLFKEAGENRLFRIYLSLSEAYVTQGNFNLALEYALLGEKNMAALHDERLLDILYIMLGNIYRELDEPKQSTDYYKRGLDLAGTKTSYSYIVLKYYVDGLIRQKKFAGALTFVKTFTLQRPPESISEQAINASAFGDCYNGLGNFKMAETWYLKMIRFMEEARNNDSKKIFASGDLSDAEAYYEISKLYSDNGKFKTVGLFLQKAFTFPNLSPLLEKNLRYLQFKSDSASGNYVSAIKNYQRSTFLKDSVFKAERLKELAQIRVKYETAEQEKNIRLLESESKLQKRNLDSANQSKRIILGGIAILFLLVALLYNRYRIKQKSNILLQEQKEIVNNKNISLVDLVKEKEWLLRELHHRVKNNLQIVVSLLHSQSVYLKDEAALNAVKESRHRVQAMSLIHQKLYKTDNTSIIYMPEYIGELIEYLKESYKTGLQIVFNINITPISLDVLHAIPIGLILNEIITNSLKYAFPNTDNDTILISLEKDEHELVTLTIADNGRGLPKDFHIGMTASFGLLLVQGLVEDLGGSLTIENREGTFIRITFYATSPSNFSI